MKQLEIERAEKSKSKNDTSSDEIDALKKDNDMLKRKLIEYRQKLVDAENQQKTALSNITIELKNLQEQNSKLQKEMKNLKQNEKENPERASQITRTEDLERTISSLLETKMKEIIVLIEDRFQKQVKATVTQSPATSRNNQSTYAEKTRTRKQVQQQALRLQILTVRVSDDDSIGTASSLIPAGRTPNFTSAGSNEKQAFQFPQRRKNNPPQEKDSAYTKVLVIPNHKNQRVTQLLQEKKLKARALGIKNAVEFPSGAALLTMEKSKAESTLQKIQEETGAQQKRIATERTPRRTFKIHDIPKDITEEELKEDIAAAFTQLPEKIIFAPYKSPEKTVVKMAIVEVCEKMYQTALNKKTIFVEYQRCRIDSTQNLMRCKECNALGHTKNHCKGIPEAVKLDQEKNAGCLDCTLYNSRMSKAGFPKSRWRPSNHKLNSKDCPSKAAYEKKLRRVLEDTKKQSTKGIEGPTVAMQNGQGHTN